jgi:hypothetical protein
MIDTALVIQTVILSGALGYMNLQMLQNRNAVSGYMSSTDANYWRILWGVADYLIYLAVQTTASIVFKLKFEINLAKLPSVLSAVPIIAYAIITAAISWVVVLIFSKIRKHTRPAGSSVILSVRETAFSDYGDNSAIRVDVFDFTGTPICSGYLKQYDSEITLSGDLLLHPLEKDDKEFTSETALILAGEYENLYVDTKNKLKVYTTPTFWEQA